MAWESVPTLECSKSYTCGDGPEMVKSLEGYYLGARKVASEMNAAGFTLLHVFSTPDGNIGLWGKTNLDSQLTSVTPGTMTRVVFTGMRAPTKKGRKPSYTYKVDRDKANTIEVDFGSASTIKAADDGVEYDDPEDADGEGETFDAPVPAAPRRPSTPLSTPSASSQAATRALLSGRR